VTASFPDLGTEKYRLPIWRLIAGVAVMGILIALLVTAGLVYVDNFRFDKYMRALAEEPGSAALSDAVLMGNILDRAKQLDLPVHRNDVTITRIDGRPHIRIARYGVQTYLGRMDLRLPEAESR
jgi:hypothetical protein